MSEPPAPPPEAAPPAAAEPPAEVPPPCPNCGAPVPERWCSRCGQDRGRTPHVPLSVLLGEAVSELFALDGRMARTVLPFFFRPGFLTAEYLAGRRVRYSSPLRLYLLTTLLFFLVAAQGESPLVHTPKNGKTGFVIGYQVDPEPAAGPAGASGPSGPEAGRGAGKQILVGGDRELTPEEQAKLDEEVARLRARKSLWSDLLADRLELLRRLPPGEASRRVGQAILEQTPRVLFFLVPVMAGLLALLHLRRGVFYAEHFVFALHAHALGFALLVPGEALDQPWLTVAGGAGAALHVLLGMRRVYGAPWWSTALRFLALAIVYSVALGAGIAAAALLALAFL